MKRVLMLSGAFVLSIALATAAGMAAYAVWSVPAAPATITVKAASMPTGLKPTVVKDGNDIVVTWGAVSIIGGPAITSYRIRGYASASSSVVVCANATTTCRATQSGAVNWEFTVQPLFHSWAGDEGPRGAVVPQGNGTGKPSQQSKAGATTVAPSSSGEPSAGPSEAPSEEPSEEPSGTPSASPSPSGGAT